MDEIKQQLLDPNRESSLAAFNALRKLARKKDNISSYTDELHQMIQSDDLEIKTLVFKLGKTFFNNLSFSHFGAADFNLHRETVRMFVSLYLTALPHRLAAVRKEAIYGIDKIRFCFVRSGNIEHILGEDVLGRIAPHLADTGTDLDENGEPTQTKGTLTIADKVGKLIWEYPKGTDFTLVFYELIPALERLHYYMSNHIIDYVYGQKLVDKVVDIFEVLIGSREVDLPVPHFPDVFPNYIVELINFCNNHQFHMISDSDIRCIRRQLIMSKRYLGKLVQTLQIDDYPAVKDSVLYLLDEAVEKGYSLKFFIPQFQELISNEKISEDQLPDSIKAMMGMGEYNQSN